MTQKRWHVDNNRGVNPKIRDAYDYPIATVALANTPEETQEIARLIAVAPDLLAACQGLINYRDRNSALNFQLEKADDWINLMRAAVDKANNT